MQPPANLYWSMASSIVSQLLLFKKKILVLVVLLKLKQQSLYGSAFAA